MQSLDADALGTLYLESHGEHTVAQEVLTYATSAFAVNGRSVVRSSDTATYNMDYAAHALNSIAALTPAQAPLQADQTVASPAYGAAGVAALGRFCPIPGSS